MYPLKLAAALSVAVVAATVISTRLTTQTPVPAPQLPFDTPSWVPDEATKKKALMKAYEMTGTMNLWGGVDVSDLLEDPPPMPPDPLPHPTQIPLPQGKLR